jgi:hypothetical protein
MHTTTVALVCMREAEVDCWPLTRCSAWEIRRPGWQGRTAGSPEALQHGLDRELGGKFAMPVPASPIGQGAAQAGGAQVHQAHGVFVAGTPAAVGCAGHLDAVAVAVSVEVGDHGWPFTDCSAFS